MDLDFLSSVRRESDRFLAVLREASPAARVPSCPDWDAADLLWHLADVQWFWGTIVAERLQEVDEDTMERPDRPAAYADLLTFAAEQTDRLHEALRTTDPATPVWMWADEKNAGYIARRQAHEALIHRVDAELTTSAVSDMDPALASDGVHEVLTKMLGGVPTWGSFTPTGPHISIESTDTGLVAVVAIGRFTGTSPQTGNVYDEPSLRLEPDSARFPAATVRGTAGQLDSWLWGRLAATALEVTGDPAAFAGLQAVVAEGID